MTTFGRWWLLGAVAVALSACPRPEVVGEDGGGGADGPDAGESADAGSPAPTSLCAPNPCGGARPVCVARQGVAECHCPEGFAPEGAGCATTPVFDCAAAHPGQGDWLEPDECPAQAKPLALGAVDAQHTLAPAGDVDWLVLEGQLGHVTELTLTAAEGLAGAAVQAFALDGLTPLALEARGQAQTTLRVKQRTLDKFLVRVRGLPPGAAGGYLLDAHDLGLDDVGDVTADAAALAVGAPWTGALETGDDVDVFTVPLLPSTKYRFTVTGTPGLHLELRAPDDTSGLGASDLAPILLRARAPGLYLVRVSNGLKQFGPYTLTVESLGLDDCGDTPADATALSPGASKFGVLESSIDVDAYSVAVQSGHAYSVTVGSSYSVRASVVDANGTELLPPAGYGPLVFTASADGVDTVLVKPAYVSSSFQPLGYTVLVADLGKDDYGDTPATATAVSAGTSGSGRFTSTTDVDMLTFSTVAPRVYGVSCSYTSPTSSCEVAVTDRLGAQLALASGYTSPSTATFRSPSSGPVTAAFRSGYSAGPYTWAVVDLGLDDCGDDPSTATMAAAPPTSGTGSIQFQGDHDVYGFGVDAGLVYQFSCTALVPGSSACALALLDGSGATLARSTSSSAGTTVLAWETLQAGSLFVDVTAPNAAPQGYRWALATNGADDYGDTRATAATAVLGSGPSLGHFETPADVDVFTFPATAGHVYQFNCALSGGTCTVRFSDASGTVLRDDGNPYGTGLVAVSAKALATGPLYVSASPGTSYGGWTATAYQWWVADLGPDDCGDTTADATPVQVLAKATAGAFEYGADVDVLSFSALAGQLFRFTCTRPSAGSCMASVRTANGQPLAGSGSGAPVTSFKSPSAGTLYAVLAPASYGSGVLGTYTWLLEDLGRDDYGDDVASATSIALATATVGSLELFTDVDSFAVTLTGGTAYQVTNGLPGSLSVTVYAPNGYSVVSYTSAPPFTFTASAGTGNYGLLVRSSYSTITPAAYSLMVK